MNLPEIVIETALNKFGSNCQNENCHAVAGLFDNWREVCIALVLVAIALGIEVSRYYQRIAEVVIMQRDQVLSVLIELQPALRNLGVRSLALFGSVARDQATPQSDVDILVELEPPITFDKYMDVKFYLEDHLGTRVDLVSWGALNPLIRATVEREAIYVPQS